MPEDFRTEGNVGNKMKILVVTDVLWRTDNGVGNSYSNIFSNLQNVEIRNICCQEGPSDNTISSGCFQIGEARLIKNLINKNYPAGAEEKEKTDTVEVDEQKDSKNSFLSFLVRSRLQILLWIREAIWKIGRWKSPELREFVDNFQPDIIFAQLQDKMYMNNLIIYLQEYLKKPLVVYSWDDVYSLRQFSLSPLFWIDRLFQRTSIRSLMKRTSLLYTISEEQKEEYHKSLGIDTDLLYKGMILNELPQINSELSSAKSIQMLYTGNLYSGRYQTILSICKIINKINSRGVRIQLHIFSGTNLSEKQKRRLCIGNSSFFEGSISEKEVVEKQKEADVLLHIEPKSLKGRLLCRLSFSTKLVDYFSRAKCIFAVGDPICSSIAYLQRNDAAIVVNTVEQAEEALNEMISKPELIPQYAKKAFDCGKRNHDLSKIQERLIKKLELLCRGVVI